MDEISKMKLIGIITDLMGCHKVPGLSITITREDRVVFNEGFGARNLEQGIPADPQTLFCIGSITKSLTAFGLMRLVEQGKIALRDSVSSYLENPLFSRHPEITIEHLLSHSSGIPSLDGSVFPLLAVFGSYKNLIPLTSRKDFMRYLSGAAGEVLFDPGEKFFYNNDMYSCIGLIIEDLTGKGFSDYIGEEVLEPLGMNRAAFTREKIETDPLANRLTGYMVQEKNGKTLVKPENLPFVWHLCAPGGLYCSTEELSRYARCLAEGGSYMGTHLLSPEGVRELWTPRISTPYGQGSDPRYCLGWVREDDFFGTTLIHHAGSIGISSAFLAILPDMNITISIAENDGQCIASSIGRAAAALVCGAEPADAVTSLGRKNIAELIRGSYYTYGKTYRMEVSLEGGILCAEVETDDGLMKFPLIPENDSTLSFKTGYYIPAKREGVKFLIDDTTGAVRHATYDRYLFHRE